MLATMVRHVIGIDPDRDRITASAVDKALALGYNHSCAIATDDTIACWGQNGNRQIDPPAGTYKALALGEYRTCDIKSDNTIVCWPQLPDGVRWAG